MALFLSFPVSSFASSSFSVVVWAVLNLPQRVSKALGMQMHPYVGLAGCSLHYPVSKGLTQMCAGTVCEDAGERKIHNAAPCQRHLPVLLASSLL